MNEIAFCCKAKYFIINFIYSVELFACIEHWIVPQIFSQVLNEFFSSKIRLLLVLSERRLCLRNRLCALDAASHVTAEPWITTGRFLLNQSMVLINPSRCNEKSSQPIYFNLIKFPANRSRRVFLVSLFDSPLTLPKPRAKKCSIEMLKARMDTPTSECQEIFTLATHLKTEIFQFAPFRERRKRIFVCGRCHVRY